MDSLPLNLKSGTLCDDLISWRVSEVKQIDPLAFIRFLPNILPNKTVLYIEMGIVHPEIISFLIKRKYTNPIDIQPRPTRIDFISLSNNMEGVVILQNKSSERLTQPKPSCHHMLVTTANIKGLSILFEKYGMPEKFIHLIAYKDNYIFFEWYNAFRDPLEFSNVFGEEQVKKFCNEFDCVSEKVGEGLHLNYHNYWVVKSTKGINPSVFYKYLLNLLPAQSNLYLECGVIHSVVREYFQNKRASQISIIREGGGKPPPEEFHIPITEEVCKGLSELSNEHVDLIVCLNLVAYKGNNVVFEWHDAFSNEIQFSIDFPEKELQEFCKVFGCSYVKEIVE